MSEPERKRVRFPLSVPQSQFLDATEPIRGFIGGQGAGKTRAGAYDLLRRAKAGRTYGVASPTYTMLRDSTFRSFEEVARLLGQFIHATHSDGRLNALIRTHPRGIAEVLFRSGDNPERLRGPNLSGYWLDEASLLDYEAFQIALARLREGGEMGWLTATFTPKGLGHWTYEVFGKRSPGTFLVHARTADSPFLSQEFIDLVQQQFAGAWSLQELGGEFVDLAGTLFRRAWLSHLVDTCPVQARRVRYWDKAGTEGGGAYSCGVLVAKSSDGLFWIEDVVRGQWSSHERNQVMEQTAEQDRARHGAVTIWVEQEPGSGGKESAELTIRQLAGYPVYAERVTGDKITRAMPLAAQCEAGNVRLVRSPWIQAFIEEMVVFPSGKYKDQVDAAGGAFNKLAAAPPAFVYRESKLDGRSEVAKMPKGVFNG